MKIRLRKKNKFLHALSFSLPEIRWWMKTKELWCCGTKGLPRWRPSLRPGLFLRPTFSINFITGISKQIVHAFVSQHWKQSRHLASPRHKYIRTVELHSLRKNKISILAKTKTPDQITNHWKNQHSSGGLDSHQTCCEHKICTINTFNNTQRFFYEYLIR